MLTTFDNVCRCLGAAMDKEFARDGAVLHASPEVLGAELLVSHQVEGSQLLQPLIDEESGAGERVRLTVPSKGGRLST